MSDRDASGGTRAEVAAGALVVVQARFGSSRLPGKVLRRLGDRTVLSHVLRRARAIPGINRVICAVAEGPDSDPVAREAEACEVTVARGSERDVLQRSADAARPYAPGYVVRITSDCPLLDPALCGEVLRHLINTGADYACNATPPSFPHGLDCEAFRFAWLERAAREARKPSEREHVTQFMRNHPDCRMVSVEGPSGDAAKLRWTLDTPADLELLTKIFARLPSGPAAWNYKVPLEIVTRDPELAVAGASQDRHGGLRRSLREDAARDLDDGRRDINLRGTHGDVR